MTTTSEHEDATDLDEIRRKLLMAALPHIAFDGWNDQVLTLSAEETGCSPLDVHRAFPKGIEDLLDFHLAEADREMVRAILDLPLAEMRIRDRITQCVRLRLEQAEANREAVRRGLTHLGLVTRAPRAMKALYRTVDLMWRAIGDRSTDFNFYTKRTLLSGVYASTLLFWLSDNSEGRERTWAFLDRRIGDVMRIEKAKAQMKKVGGRLPDPLKIARRLPLGRMRRI